MSARPCENKAEADNAMGRLAGWTRAVLMPIKVHKLPGAHVADPYSPEYLFLVQQSKRLSLSRSIGHLRPRNLPVFPLLLIIILAKAFDLWLANLLVRSLINERDLQQQAIRER
jgi:hypothetical protein